MGLVVKLLVGWCALSVPVGVLLGRVLRLRERVPGRALGDDARLRSEPPPARRAG